MPQEMTYDEIMRRAKAALQPGHVEQVDRELASRKTAGTIGPDKRGMFTRAYDYLSDQPVVKFAGDIADAASIPAMVSPAGVGVAALQGIRSAVNPRVSMIERGIGAGMAALPGVRLGKAAASSVNMEERVRATSPMMRKLSQWGSKGKTSSQDISHGVQRPDTFVNQTPQVVDDVIETQIQPTSDDIQGLIAQLRGSSVPTSARRGGERIMSGFQPREQKLLPAGRESIPLGPGEDRSFVRGVPAQYGESIRSPKIVETTGQIKQGRLFKAPVTRRGAMDANVAAIVKKLRGA